MHQFVFSNSWTYERTIFLLRLPKILQHPAQRINALIRTSLEVLACVAGVFHTCLRLILFYANEAGKSNFFFFFSSQV